MKIKDRKIFHKEKLQFKKIIDSMTDSTQKNSWLKIYNEWLTEITAIDVAHDSTFGAQIDPRSIKENVIKAGTLRKKLYKLVEDSK